MDLQNKILNKWKDLESSSKQPEEINKVNQIDYREFDALFQESNFFKIEKIMEDFFSGSVFALKNSFTKEFFEEIKLYLKNNYDNQVSKFYKTKEGCPNFHRIVGEKESSKYVLKSNRHDYYFFPWNRQKEKLDLFDYFYPKWRLIKLLSGLRKNAFENNTPKDGEIDRLLFRIYPHNTGHLEVHSDPATVRIVSGTIMSKKGEDFDDGGVFFFKDGKIFDVEVFFDVGDVTLFYHSLKHGVKKISSKQEDNKNKDRWWICLTNPISDEIENRTVQKSIY